MSSFISWLLPSVPSWLTPGTDPLHSVLQGIVGACGILVLRNLLNVYLFVDDQSVADPKTDHKPNKRNAGLTEKIQFWVLTVVLSIVGSRVASLVVLEFSLRVISARITGRSDSVVDPLLQQLIQCQFSLGCALSCSLNFLHEGAPQAWLSLLLAVGLSWFLASQCCKLWQHVQTMYPIHSTQRYCGLCIGLLTTGSSILTWLCSALIITFSVSGIAAISNINQHFLSTTEALRFWTPLTICYTLLVVYMNGKRTRTKKNRFNLLGESTIISVYVTRAPHANSDHGLNILPYKSISFINVLSEDQRQPGQQALLNTVVVRLGGLFVLLITVGRWSDVLHVLICFIGEAVCLLLSQDFLEAIYKHVIPVPERSLKRPGSQTGPKKWGRFD